MPNLSIPTSLIVLFYFFEGLEITDSFNEEETFLEIIEEFERNNLATYNLINILELNNLLNRGGLFKVAFSDDSKILLKRRNDDLIFKSHI